MDNNEWVLHTVLVPKFGFSVPRAINYIEKHFKYKKFRETRNYYRFRQKDPYNDAIFFTKVLDNGVQLIFMKHK